MQPKVPEIRVGVANKKQPDKKQPSKHVVWGIVGQSLWLGVVIAMLLCSGALMYRAVMGEPSPSVLAARSTEKASTNEPCAISSYEPNEPALETNAIILKSNLQRVDKKKKQFRVQFRFEFSSYIMAVGSKQDFYVAVRFDMVSNKPTVVHHFRRAPEPNVVWIVNDPKVSKGLIKFDPRSGGPINGKAVDTCATSRFEMSGEHGVRTIFRVAADLNFAAKTLVLKISKGGEATYKVVYNESVKVKIEKEQLTMTVLVGDKNGKKFNRHFMEVISWCKT